MKLVNSFTIDSNKPAGIRLRVEISKERFDGLPSDEVKKVMDEAIRHLELIALGRQREPSDLGVDE